MYFIGSPGGIVGGKWEEPFVKRVMCLIFTRHPSGGNEGGETSVGILKKVGFRKSTEARGLNSGQR